MAHRIAHPPALVIMNPLSHIVIIGAGPAGCSAACHLARAGTRVTLLESKSFPRVKVCGEYVSPAGTADLESLLPAAKLTALGARKVHRFALVRHARGRDHRIEWTTPAPAWALSRSTLDDAMVAYAKDLGVNVLQPAAVRDVEYLHDRVHIRLTSGDTVHASLVIHADGSGRHDPAGPVPATPGLVGLKCHARLPATQCADSTVEMRAGSGLYVGSVRVEADLVTIALCAQSSLLREHAGDHDALVAQCWPTWSASWRTTEWLGSPVPRARFITPGHPRSFRAGNAAAAVDPVGGEGIASALWSGRLLAHLLLDADLSDSVLPFVHARYARAYAARLRTRLPACRLGAELLMRPHALSALWPLLRVPSLTIAPWYALTGKPMHAAESAG